MMHHIMTIVALAAGTLILLGVIGYFYFIYAPSPAEPALSAKVGPNTIMLNECNRTYLSYIPQSLPANPSLVIALHGTGMNAERMREWTGYELDKLADQYGFIVVYPDGYKGNWNECRIDSPYAAKQENIDDVGFIRHLIDRFQADHGVPPGKVYSFGFSSGGQMAFRLAIEVPQAVEAVCAIGANLPTPDTCSCTQQGVTSRIMLVVGTRDPINPYQGGKVSLFGLKRVGTALSSQATAESFAIRNGIVTTAAMHGYPNRGAVQSTSIKFDSWSRSGRAVVSLYTAIGGGHTIPQPVFRFPRLMGKTPRDFNAPLQAITFFGLMESSRGSAIFPTG
jgi:polyhydroxybutyrate depolymerase